MIGMIWWALGGQQTRRRTTTKGLILRGHRRRKADKRYLKAAVRRMELNAEARRIYAQRHPAPAPRRPQVIQGGAPESRYSNPEFWSNRR